MANHYFRIFVAAPTCFLARSVQANLQPWWKWQNRGEEGTERESPKEDRNVSHPLCFEYGMRRPVSCCFGFQMGQHIRVLSAHSVLIPTARRDFLSMDQIDNLGSLVYVRLCCRTMTYSQQVQSVYAHLFTGGSLACAWASPVKKSLWRISGGSKLATKAWSHRHLQHRFYIPNITLIP